MLLSFKQTKFLIVMITISCVLYVISNISVLFTKNILGMEFTYSSLTFPFLYIASDIIQEIYGYEYSRLAGKLTAMSQLIFGLSMYITSFFNIQWIETNHNTIIRGNVLLNIASITTLASIISYYVGDYFNDKIFSYYYKKNSGEGLYEFFKRGYISSIVEKVFDFSVYNGLVYFLMPFFTTGKFLVDDFTFILNVVVVAFFFELLVELVLMPFEHRLIMYVKNRLVN